MDEGGVELVWMKTKDLCLSNASDVASRRAVMALYAAIVAGQFENIDVMRACFFRAVETRAKAEEDLEPRPSSCSTLSPVSTRP